MTTTLITGATRGLGRESARRLVEAGHTVYLGARDPERGREAADAVGARLVVVDVVDDASVAAAAEQVGREVGSLDVLVNNAGIPGSGDGSPEDARAVYETNVLGVVRVTRAFLPLLRAAPAPLVINLSSALGSLAIASDLSDTSKQGPYLAYASSKAALNMLTVQYARSVPEVRFLAVSPGLTATDFTGSRGGSVEDGAEVVVTHALLGGAAPTAAFVSREGPVPW